jgi:hypothetical protein
MPIDMLLMSHFGLLENVPVIDGALRGECAEQVFLICGHALKPV